METQSGVGLNAPEDREEIDDDEDEDDEEEEEEDDELDDMRDDVNTPKLKAEDEEVDEEMLAAFVMDLPNGPFRIVGSELHRTGVHTGQSRLP